MMDENTFHFDLDDPRIQQLVQYLVTVFPLMGIAKQPDAQLFNFFVAVSMLTYLGIPPKELGNIAQQASTAMLNHYGDPSKYRKSKIPNPTHSPVKVVIN